MGFDRQHRLDAEPSPRSDRARHEKEPAPRVPGRQTRVEQLLAQATATERLELEDYRVLALRDVLRRLARVPELHDPTIAVADREIARRALPALRPSSAHPPPATAAAAADGRAMWRAAERRAVTLYRRARDAGGASPDDPAVEAALARAGSGTPLPADVRRRMEDALGVSLASVRVHTDAVAADAARAVHAEAFTVGEDIFFAEGTFSPGSSAGQRLLAHELAHVLQHRGGRIGGGAAGGGIRVSQPGDALEQEADAIAERIERTDGAAPSAIARDGTSGRGGPLPHLATIQQLFGQHDVSGVRAHGDALAANAAAKLGAQAFTHGDDVAFAGTPDLHTAAHEAAHVVQQRAGVQIAGGVGAVDDEHEHHADAVADQVVRGESAEPLLDRYGPRSGGASSRPAGGGPATRPVQLKKKHLEQALGLDDLPVATAYFKDHPISKRTVLAFIGDRAHPRYERETVFGLWNRGYEPSSTGRGLFIGRDQLYREPKVRDKRRPAKISRKKRSRSRSTEREQRDPKRRRVNQHISYAYWNMERLGASSARDKIQGYVDYVLDVLETYHPSFMAFEEMGDAVHLFGQLLLSSDLFARYVKHAQEKLESEPSDDEDGGSSSETDSGTDSEDDLEVFFDQGMDLVQEENDPEDEKAYLELMTLFAKAQALREQQRPGTGEPSSLTGGYQVRREYGYMPGPQFYNGNFREYYPLIFDKAVVIGTPELLVTERRDIKEIQSLDEDDQVLKPYFEPRPFQAGKNEDDDSKDNSRTPRGPAFWKIKMKSLHHNTRRERQDGEEVPPPEHEILEIYLGIVHTSPGMLNPDIKYILDAAAELIPEDKPVIIGGDWYMQRGAKRFWAQLQDDEVWALGLPPGTTNYKPGKTCQKADHGLFNKSHVTLGGTPIRIQPTSQIPYEGLTGIDQEEMYGEREEAPTAREVKDQVGSDHTNIFMSLTLHPEGKRDSNRRNDKSGSTKGTARRDPKEPAVERMKQSLLKSKTSGTRRPISQGTIATPSGATLHINETDGDGNCFYHSVYECLIGERSSGDAQAQVRRQAVNAMLTDPEVQRHLFGEIPDLEAMSEVITELLKDGTWTEDFSPSFIAEALNLEIHVLTSSGAPHYTASPAVPRDGMRTIYCVFTGFHYNSCTEQALPPQQIEIQVESQ